MLALSCSFSFFTFYLPLYSLSTIFLPFQPIYLHFSCNPLQPVPFRDAGIFGISEVARPFQKSFTKPSITCNAMILINVGIPSRSGCSILTAPSKNRFGGLEIGRPGFEPRFFCVAFSASSRTSDFKTGTPVATLPGAWRHKVNAGTGWPAASIL